MQESQPYHFAAPNELHLWLLLIADVPVEYLPGYYRLLSPDESERNRRYVFEKDRIRHLLSRVFVRKLLANYLSLTPDSLRFETNTYGRPTLVWPDGKPKLDFNISHAGDMIACAVVPDGRVGIDIEPIDREVNIRQASHFFSKIELEELALLSGERQKEHFLRLWTLKEAYIKARGQGLSIPLDSFAFHDFGEGSFQFWENNARKGDKKQWWFCTLHPTLDCRLAAAWQTRSAGRNDLVSIRLYQFFRFGQRDAYELPFSIEHLCRA